jgi:hypothetical protein
VKRALALSLFLVTAAACDRSKPYDNAPNYDEAGCTAAGGAVEKPPSSVATDGGFQDFLDQGCASGVFLGYAIVQGEQTAAVALCCSM